ncbi:MAG: translocation/assembly module TamB domain-containing protein, partial [Pseudomonadota bacterium]
GQGALDASGAPRALDARLALAGDGPVRLPGSDVRLDAADLTLAFDAAAGPDWRLDGTLAALDAGLVRIADAELAGTGQIMPGGAAPLTGRLEMRARGVEAPGDPRLTAVIGPEVSLVTGLRLDAQNAFALQGLRLTSPHLTLAGDLGGTPTDGRVLLGATLRADVPDLAPFGGFAGLPLAGALGADLTMSAELPGGAIAVELAGQSRGLDIGQPALTPLLAPQTDLALSLRRDAAGTELERFALTNVALSVAAEGQIDDADGALDLTARLEDAGTFDARLAGPVDLSATLREVQTRAAVTARLEAAFGLDAALTGALRGEAAGLEFEGTFAEVERFAAPLTGRVALDGALTLTGPHPVLRTDLSVAPGMTARLTGPVSGPQAALDFAARLEDLGAIVAALPGPARVDGTLDLTGDAPRLRAAATAQPGLSATVEGALGGTPITLEAQIADLASFVPVLPGPATLSAAVTDPTGVPALAAALTAPRGFTARVSGRPLGEDGRLDLTAEAANLGLFVPQLPGAARLEAALTDPTGAQRFSADLAGPGLSATVTGDPDAIDLRAQLDRIARFAPGLGGGATLEAALRDLRGARQVEADVRTTSGAAARVSGQVPAGAADLRVTGNVPLALATPFVGDRALSGSTDLDLALRGPLSLSGLSGAVRITGGRLFDPGVGLTVEALSAQVDIAGGAAQLSASGTANEGTLRLGGRVGLTAPFETDLDVQAAGLVYRIAGLLRSRIDAQIALRGAASTRLAATGDIALSETEIRVPDTGLGGATAIPDITHIGAPPGVQRTRARAGLSGRNSGGAGDGGIAVPLDIRITARQSIFLRGRGLDAAFGGALRLGGTAARPEPVGQFSLERGRLDFLGRRLNLTEGRVLLTGVQVPEIQVVAQSLLDAITAQVTVSGPADALEVSVSSTPPLPEDEVLARLLFGRSFDTLSPFQLAQLVASIHTLAGKGSSLTGNARRVFGVDDFDARTDEVTGETELSFGQRINEDIYSEVEVGTQGDVQLNLNLDIGRNTRLRGSASNTGNAGIGIFWDRDY